MTNTPDLTSPEAVERYSPIAVAPHDADPFGAMETDPEGGFVLYEDYAALSAALEAAEMSAKHWHARAKAAEAERDSLKAGLAEAVGALQKIESRPDKMTWGEDYEVSEAMRDMEETARAFLARHQKGADT